VAVQATPQAAVQAPIQRAPVAPKADFSTFAAALAAANAQAVVAKESGATLAPAPAMPVRRSAKAILAAGCFWGIEMVFDYVNGVSNSVSGYSGGLKSTANYEMVSNKKTDHAEAVEITYDPSVVSYIDLVRVLFAIHDPTTLNYQKPDTGRHYRSAVHYSTLSEKQDVEQVIREERFTRPNPIVTEVAPLKAFYPAEDYHQDFARLQPDYPYIVRWDLEKLVQLKDGFPTLFNYTKMNFDMSYRDLSIAAFA
jgi:peptide-methionine (S)-S-oxide reductase